MSSDLPIAAQPVLDLRFWRRGLRDYSGFGNHAVVDDNSPAWVRVGQQDMIKSFSTVDNSHLTVPSDSSLVGDGLTLFVCGDFREHGNNTFMVLATGGTPWFYTLTNNLVLKQDSNFSLRAANIVGARAVAVTATAAAAKPKFYVDDQFVGLGSVDLTMTTSPGKWKLMGSAFTGMFNNPVCHIMAFLEPLEPEDIAALFDYTTTRHTPERLWPGMGLQYQGANLIVDGDQERPDLDHWAPVNNADLQKIQDGTARQGSTYQRIEYDGTTNPQSGPTPQVPVGRLGELSFSMRSDGATQWFVRDGSSITLVIGNTDPVWTDQTIVYTPTSTLRFLAAATAAGQYCDLDNVRFRLLDSPFSAPSGRPVFMDSIQYERVSLRDWTSGELGRGPFTIRTGIWRVDEDATGRCYNCVASGQLTARLIGANGFTTHAFETEGTATLTKTATQLQIDATAGAKVRRVEIVA